MIDLLPGETPFLQGVLDDPEDPAARLVYADWLEEQGDERAEYLRLTAGAGGRPGDAGFESRRRVELASRLDSAWLAAIGRPPQPIAHCTQSPCPGDWRSLEPTHDATVRRCHECLRPVFFCRGELETRMHAHHGDRVVMPVDVRSRHQAGHVYEEPLETLREVAEQLGPERMAFLVKRRQRAIRFANPLTRDES